MIGVGVGLLLAGPVGAQSASFGNGVIDVVDADGDRRFQVDAGAVRIGELGADMDFYIYDTTTGLQTLYFNTSLSNFYLGSADAGGTLYLRDIADVTTVFANGTNGDVAFGGGTQDGDITVRDENGITNLTVNGSAAHLTVGAHGVAGDGGRIYLRDTNGVTNNIYMDGASGNMELGANGGADDGDLDIWDGSTRSIYMRGTEGSLYNQITGNGLVKAWARINADGSVASCFRCVTGGTGNLSTGNYEVDFSIDTNIDSRPVTCSIGHNDVGFSAGDSIYCVGRALDDSSIFVSIVNSSGTSVNSEFTAVVF